MRSLLLKSVSSRTFSVSSHVVASTMTTVRHASTHHQHHHHHSNSGNPKQGSSDSFMSSLLLVGTVVALGPAYYLWKSTLLKPSQPQSELAPTTKTTTSSSSESDQETGFVDGLPYVPYILIGSGTASYHAMLAIRKRDPKARILIVGEEDVVPYQRPPLSKELWFSQDPASLHFKDWQGKDASLFYSDKDSYTIIKTKEQFQNVGKADPSKVQLLLNATVTRLDVDKHTLILKDGRQLKYGKVLIATGGTPRRLALFDALPKDAQSRVLTFRGVKDFEKLNELAKGDKTIAIVGGGFLGSELAVALAQRAKQEHIKVIQLFPEDGNMGLVFPRYLTRWTTQRLINEGVDVRPGSEITKARVAESGKKIALSLKGDKESVEADYVVVAVGLNPNIDIARQSGLEIDEKRSGIVVNAELENRSDVFVAGDVSSFHDIALGRRRVEHYDHAVASGKRAGLNMTGDKKPYVHQSMFWSDLGPEIAYEAVGILDSKLPTVGVWAKKPTTTSSSSNQESDDFGKGIVFYMTPEKRVVGILTWNVLGKMDLARKILRDAKDGTDVNELASLFKVN